MKILILIDQMYKSGGMEKVLSSKIQYWSRDKNYEVILVTNENKGKKFYFPIHSTVKHMELDINYDRTSTLFSFRNIIKACSHYKKLSEVIENNKPDITIHCGFGFDFYFLPLIKNPHKLIKENHSSRVFSYLHYKTLKFKITNQIRMLFESLYDAMVVLSDEEKAAHLSKNVYVIPNPVEEHWIENSNAIVKTNSVISAGRITPIKGFDRLIEIWRILKKNDKNNWLLEIYGDGDVEYISELKAQVTRYKLNDSIIFHPSTYNLAKEMMRCKIYALPSHSECFPMVLLESLKYGLPSIAFDCPTGPRNIIENNITGYLVENDNLVKFADKLALLMADSELRERLSINCITESKKYQLKNIMSLWEALFSKLAN